MLFWIDTHAHIYAEEFDADRAEMIDRCQQLGVDKIYMPNIDGSSIDAMLEVENKWPQCRAMMGLHPTSVKKDFERTLYTVEEWLSKRHFAAVGEIGTDLYWDKTFRAQQVEAFTIQVGWAKQFRLPVVIHCRESLDETIALVERCQDGNLRGIFHCFTGSVTQAEKIVQLGFSVGIGGVATFKKAGMEAVLPHVPLGKIVLETDSPYLAPVPHRGKRNEPSYIPLIGQKVADIKGIPVEDVQRQTTKNADDIFNITSALR